MKKERDLPIYKCGNFEWIVDVNKNELREKGNEKNRHSIFEMKDLTDAYYFECYHEEMKKNVPVSVPQLTRLDPEGMCKKYKVTDVSGKNDFDVMVDQEAFHRRIKLGQLPTISICGHTFYADARNDFLRPKDDFSTMGISFSELRDHYVPMKKCYMFPYNPKTHRLQDLDYDNIREYPKDLVFVKVPFVRVLDPVGWNRKNGFRETDFLKELGLKLRFVGRIIPRQKVGIDELIARNQLDRPVKAKIELPQSDNFKKKGKGPKM
ncbi:hypothetical protein LZQ00_08490 [Sphingobacterium sp. SRCM116780]|uniref:hypothetical protein n=1 Tax=Sphingobacterium sp. SRCM116780 TaxID=2907623 RepID=UPI001F1B5637|nr:hypothetical protein [Sphingobacterium sp. SRCM116780]UIR57845.1 hypothetical protein LZQ00_08490 [Sphingobacterium sp. SRCM116780]